MNWNRWGALFALAFALLIAFSGSLMAAEGARPASTFDHDQTKFPLTGIHTNTACENCHVRGVFKGTPTSCSDCHNRGSAFNVQTKSPTHIPTTQECSVCHKTMGWTPATFSHTDLTQPCSTCHNNINQTGKPAFHLQTNQECGSCHKTTAWLPATSIDHSILVPPAAGRCTDCHGKTATGKPTNHVFTTAQCDACHTTATWLGAFFDHSTLSPAATGRCNDCHTKPGATNKSAKHIATSDSCDVCHTTAGWVPTSFAHSSGQVGTKVCTDCHNGVNAKGTTATHIPVPGVQCNVCHTTSGWLPTSFSHDAAQTSGKACATCHNGKNAQGKSATHISTANYPNCDTCHTTNAWKPTQFAHTGVTSSTNCVSCHDGKNAVGRPVAGAKAHKVAPMTSNSCGSCHTIGTAWAPALMNHTGLTTCAQCHVISSTGNAWTPGKAGHISTTGHAQCLDCHTVTAWKPSTFSHQGITKATNCTIGCHNVAGKQPPVAGTPTGSNLHAIAPMTSTSCGICHAIGGAWGPGTKMNHTGATACKACHKYEGNDFTPAKTGHVSTSQQCSVCHTTSNWTAFSHTGVTASSNCTASGCHSVVNQAAPVAGRPSTGSKAHTVAPMTGTTCGSCHAIGTVWTIAPPMRHTGLTNCKACHATTGTNWNAAKANHIPIGTNQCSACHITAAWQPATNFDHAKVGVTSATNCAKSGCHDTPDAATPKAGRPITGTKAHTFAPLTSNTCGSCHTIGAAWTPATMNHTGLTNCTTCHAYTGNNFTPAKAGHVGTSQQCSICHTTTSWMAYSHTGVTAATNCTQAGCHSVANQAVPVAGRPSTHTTAPMNSTSCGSCHAIGTVWGPGTKMNHSGATACSLCHSYSANPNSWTSGSPFATHISTPASQQCSTCHTTTNWMAYSHTGVTAASNCTASGCHSVVNQAAPVAGRPSTGSKAHTVAPMTGTTCGSCHAIGTVWTIAPPMSHTGLTNCKACHATTGTNWNIAKANHIPIGTSQCSACHVTTAWTPASNFNHAANGITAATNCTQAGCHSVANAPVPKAGRPSTHATAPMTSNTCATCHQIGTIWGPGTQMNHTGATACSSCHSYIANTNGWTVGAPKAGHINTTMACSSCHSTTAWTPASYKHPGVTASTNCTQAGCHNVANQGVPLAGRPSTHATAPMTSNTCATCHLIGTAWGPGTKMKHAGATLCSSCHSYTANPNGWTSGSPFATHVVTTQQCSVCHTTTNWMAYSHTGVTAATNCTQAGCHSVANQAVPVAGRPSTHTTAPMNSTSCGSCHAIGTVWGPGTKMNHSGATACSLCHSYSANPNSWTSGSPFATHISTPASQQCSTCHTTTNWMAYSHTGVTAASNCTASGCHSVVNQAAPVAGRPSTGSKAHTVAPMTGTTCGSCHAIGTVWTIAPPMSHTGLTNCKACHATTGTNWNIAKANHIPIGTSQCSACHVTTAWTPASNFNHAANGITAATNCTKAGCHSVANAPVPKAGRPSTHATAPMTSNTCATCHQIGTIWGPGTQMNHTGATACSSCHSYIANTNGWTVGAPKAGHINTTMACSSCHSTTAWTPASYKHPGVTASTNCTQAGCHNVANQGVPLAGRPSTHATAPMTSNTCATCHLIGTAWGPGTKMKHAGATLCSSCHSYTANPNGWTSGSPFATHVVTTQQCSVCHTTTNWMAYSHNGVSTATNCTVSGCHSVVNQAAPVAGRPSTGSKAHTVAPMTGTTCGSCHAIGTVWTIAPPMNHAGLTNCKACHATTGTNWNIAKANHISIGTSQCSACHVTTAWTPASNFNHAANGITAATNCTKAGCHSVANAAVPLAGRPSTHASAPMTSNTCATCHQIGTIWGPGTQMNHTGATVCSNCHSFSANPNGWTVGSPKANHVPVGTNQCSACHSTTAWKPASYNHSGVTAATNCAQAGCHNVTGQGAPVAGPPTGTQAHTYAPMNSTSCGSCHKIGTTWGPGTPMNHTGATTCSNCHSYTANPSGWTVGSPKAGHVVTGQQCSVCHTTTNWTAYSHTGVTAATNCTVSGCHSVANQAVPVAGRPSTHATAPMTSTSCGSCHAIGTIWGPGTLMNHNGATACSSCHSYTANPNGWTVGSPKAGHVVTTQQCSVCHTTANWTAYSHPGVTSATNCAQAGCHNVTGQGVPLAGPPTGTLAHTVAPMTSTACGTCHGIGTQWGPGTKMNHTGATLCSSCHSFTTNPSGWTAGSPKVNHVAIGTSQCSACHATTAWLPASAFNHAANGITAATNCTQAGCHDVSNAGVPKAGRPLTHTTAPMTSNTCGRCHQIGTVWVTTMNHTGATLCSSCHSFTTNPNGWTVGSPKANHVAIGTSQCSACHTTTAWTPASFNHTGVTAATNCAASGCHNTPNKAAPQAGQPTTGIHAHTYAPMNSTTCGSCHTIGTAWTPATMNHAGVTTCKQCHAYTGNGFTPTWATHITTTSECNVCHTTTAWTPTSFAHTAAQIGTKTCKDCHNGTSATGPSISPHNHAGISPTPYNCDACHRTTGWSPATFTHSGVTTGCANCHKTGFATTKSAAHFITTQPCEKCHTTAAWTPIRSYVHTTTTYKAHNSLSMTTYADCLLCHIGKNEVITGAPYRGIATYKPDCAWCHGQQFVAGSHPHYTSPPTNYTVDLLRNCSGACHVYTTSTSTTPSKTRNGPQHTPNGGF